MEFFKVITYLIVKFALEKKDCELSQEKWRGGHASCLIWRRFCNLFETTQSLFWAVFGLVSLSDFELKGKQGLKGLQLRMKGLKGLNRYFVSIVYEEGV